MAVRKCLKLVGRKQWTIILVSIPLILLLHSVEWRQAARHMKFGTLLEPVWRLVPDVNFIQKSPKTTTSLEYHLRRNYSLSLSRYVNGLHNINISCPPRVAINRTLWTMYQHYLNIAKLPTHQPLPDGKFRAYMPLVHLNLLEIELAAHPPTLDQYACWLADLCASEVNTTHSKTRPEGLCPCLPPGLHGFVEIDQDRLTNTSWGRLRELHPELKPGGSWAPSSCIPRRRIAIIVPFRDRETHLRAFLAHIHPIMQRQLLHYRIFVIEQNLPYLFNKAALMNAGYLEAKKLFQADCVMFHDVDTLTERDDNMVVCGDEPIHWGGYNHRYNYSFRTELFGSAVLMRPDIFESANGFSNLFFGWGGEDDAFKYRLLQKQFHIYRGPINITRCTIIGHERDVGFQIGANTTEHKLSMLNEMQSDEVWLQIDGLHTARHMYDVIATRNVPTHTWIQVNFNRPTLEGVAPGYSQLSPRQPPSDGIAPVYHAWVKKVTDIAFSKRPASFEVIKRHCVANGGGQRHFLSRVTCRFRCEQLPECGMFEYHGEPSKAMDSFCVLPNHTVINRCQNGLEPVEIHRKIVHVHRRNNRKV